MRKKERAITIKDVAKAANVSITTVSRVLNNDQYSVNEETRGRVKAIIEELNFVPNAMARGIHADRTKTIALIIQDINNAYYPGIVEGVEHAAQKMGFSLILANAHRSGARIHQYLELMREKRVDGLILAGGGIVKNAGEHRLFASESLKTVVIGKPASESGASVQIDNVAAAKMACDFLLDRNHRNIAMITGSANSTTAMDREEGYRQALTSRGIAIDKRWLTRGNFVYDGGYAAVDKLPMSGTQRITAIFAQNDLMAIGAVNALSHKGYRVPKDISVIGFDDIQLSSYVTPGLTTIHIPLKELGKKATESLVKMLNGRKMENTVYLPVTITVRGTVSHCQDTSRGI